ncbi:MAG: small, acid-soluble spore protein, alpha/beta type [Lachnospiraceae bacterium]|nr:small, acid-soluble spore protein, alpha/beta type [Lachnospiraceae bacterium]
MAKRKKEFDFERLTPKELIRFEIAKELGISEKIVTGGWGALSAQESGRIGGIIASQNRRKKALKKSSEKTEDMN